MIPAVLGTPCVPLWRAVTYRVAQELQEPRDVIIVPDVQQSSVARVHQAHRARLATNIATITET